MERLSIEAPEPWGAGDPLIHRYIISREPDGTMTLLELHPTVTARATAEFREPHIVPNWYPNHPNRNNAPSHLIMALDITQTRGEPAYTLYHIQQPAPDPEPRAADCHWCSRIVPLLCEHHRPQVDPIPPEGMEDLLLLGGPHHARTARVPVDRGAWILPVFTPTPFAATMNDLSGAVDHARYERVKLTRNGMLRPVLLAEGVSRHRATDLLADLLAAQWFGAGQAGAEWARPDVVVFPDGQAEQAYADAREKDSQVTRAGVARVVSAIRVLRAEGIETRALAADETALLRQIERRLPPWIGSRLIRVVLDSLRRNCGY